MSDIKFSCPQCQQHIQAEEGYAGMQIACPVCNAGMFVPGTPRPAPAPAPVPVPVSSAAAPVPVPPAPVSRVSVARTPAAPSQPATGTRFQPGAAAATRPQPAPAARTGVAGVLLNPLLYIALAVVVLSVLFVLGRSNTKMQLAFYCAFLLYWLVAKITVVVCGFRESASDGILTLLCDFYCVYFALRKSDSNVLKALYGSVALIALALKFVD